MKTTYLGGMEMCFHGSEVLEMEGVAWSIFLTLEKFPQTVSSSFDYAGTVSSFTEEGLMVNAFSAYGTYDTPIKGVSWSLDPSSIPSPIEDWILSEVNLFHLIVWLTCQPTLKT